MERALMINADDFGMCHAANEATMALLECGGVTSATVMTPCAWAPEAMAYAAKHPEYAVGVHLTFTSEWKTMRWRPLTMGRRLLDACGYMHADCASFEENASHQEVDSEIHAQIALFEAYGAAVSHLDIHMGALYGLEGKQSFLPEVFDVCTERGLPLRLPGRSCDFLPEPLHSRMRALADEAASRGIRHPHHLAQHSWNGTQAESYEAFRNYMYARIAAFPDGVTETYIHPAVECDELKAISAAWQHRVWEYRLFADPATREFIASCGITLISYRDLRR